MQPIKPLNYRIHLKPDLVNFNFEGACELLDFLLFQNQRHLMSTTMLLDTR